MSDISTGTRDLLARGSAAARAGDYDEARFYLEWLLRAGATEGEEIEAYLWLSDISDEPDEKRNWLEEALARNPFHLVARRKLALLDGRLQPGEIVDPDQLARPDAGTVPASTQSFLCPRCAAHMVFTPDGRGLHCEYCDYREALQRQGEVAEEDFIVAMATARGHLSPVATEAFICQSCVASFLLAPGTLSITCPYCGATHAVVTERRQLIAPQAILPAIIHANEARQIIRAWLAHHRLAATTHVYGLYLPAWRFAIGGEIGWRGYANSDGGDTMPISGTLPIHHEDILVPACQTLPEKLARQLLDYDLTALEVYEPRYLANWPAQTYQINVGDASLVARQRVFADRRAEIAAHIASENNAEGIQLSSAGMMITFYQLILLPLWLARYRIKGDTYTIVVNAQTAAIHGQRPEKTGWRHWFQ